jgi:DNA repair exonuclease SbcCD ATPase subunit
MGKSKKTSENYKAELIKTRIVQLNDDPAGLLLQSLAGESAESLGNDGDLGALLGGPEGIAEPTAHQSDAVKTKLTKFEAEKTVVAGGAKSLDANNAITQAGRPSSASEATVVVGKSGKNEQVAFGIAKASTRAPASEHAASVEAQIQVSDSLRLAQNQISEMENELEKLRAENEKLSSLNQQSAERLQDYTSQVESLEKQKNEVLDQYSGELSILRENLREKERQVVRLQQKADELEARVGRDLRKIRVRERELENRLEIAKVEREALLRAKDETYLELQQRLQDTQAETDAFKARLVELNKQLDGNNEQVSRTVRALRLALTNLEGGDSATAPIPLKKAE